MEGVYKEKVAVGMAEKEGLSRCLESIIEGVSKNWDKIKARNRENREEISKLFKYSSMYFAEVETKSYDSSLAYGWIRVIPISAERFLEGENVEIKDIKEIEPQIWIRLIKCNYDTYTEFREIILHDQPFYVVVWKYHEELDRVESRLRIVKPKEIDITKDFIKRVVEMW